MNPFQTTDEQRINVARLGVQMTDAGLSAHFVVSAMTLAAKEQGAYDLMELWSEAETSNERDEIVADLQEALEEYADEPPVPTAKPRIDFDRLDEVVHNVMAHKARLRDLIDRHGGVSAVAKASGIPQPSLSRLLNSGSMPRRSTLYRIATALDVEEREIVTDWVR